MNIGPTSRKPTPLWRQLNFSLMWTSTAASGFGDRMIMQASLALLGGLAAMADSTSLTASTQFWFFLPYLFFSIVGGWLSDRLPRKWVLLGCDESRGLILLYCAWMLAAATGEVHIPQEHYWKVYTSLFAIGSFAAIFNPARNAIIPQIIPRKQLQAGNAIILVIAVIASMIGLVAGGMIIKPEFASTVKTCLIVGALFYLISGWFFAFLKPIAHQSHSDKPTPTPKIKHFGYSLKYCLAHRRILGLILMNMLVWSVAAIVACSMFGLSKHHFQLSGQDLLKNSSNVSATLGVGMLIGAGIIAWVRTRREAGLIMFTSFMFVGLFLLTLALIPVLWVMYASAFFIGVFGNMIIISVMTLLQTSSANFIRGRVMGLNSMANTTCSVLTYYCIWRLPNADMNIRYVLLILGPALLLLGITQLFRYTTTGLAHNRIANACWRIERLYCFIWHRLEVRGQHHVPHTGAVILAANHTTGLDPFVMQARVTRLIRWLMMKNYQYKAAAPLWNAINPIAIGEDESRLSQVRTLVNILKQGDIVGLFPEGALQREVRELKEFQSGITWIAKKSGAVIVPVWIEGTPLKHKMIWHFLCPSKTTVTFGKPMSVGQDDDENQALVELRERMLALK
jgi:1-acyl-sn-glycerol-3-phosphate acyltransferase